MLKIERPRTRQPKGAAKINWGNSDTLGLAGAWPLQDGQFRDATGRYNGTLNSGVTPSVSQLGRTLTFNGTSGVVSLAAVASGGLDLSNKNHSVSLWLYPTTLTGFRVIFHQYNGSVGPVLFTNGTSLIWQVGNSSNRITATSGVDLDKWQHFVVTYAPSSLAIYKNGALLQSGTPTTQNTSTATAQWGGNSSLGWYTTGQMAAPAVWTRTLSAAEARRQHEATRELYAPRSIWVPVSAGGGGTTHAATGVLAGAGGAIDGTAARTRAHPTTGVLAGGGGAITGTAAHIAIHGTSGVLAGSGATVDGAAARTRAHPTSGVLAGSGGVVDGTARHNVPHATTGVLAGAGGAVVGSADHTVPGGTHDTSGALAGGGGAIDGTAAHVAIHGTSGALAGAGGAVVGTAARVAVHDTSGALVGGGGSIDGVARGPDADAAPRRHAGYRREQVRKGYIIKGKRYWLTDDELMVLVAQQLTDISRKEVKQITQGKPKPISKKVWDLIAPMERLQALEPIEIVQDDDEEDVLMMFV